MLTAWCRQLPRPDDRQEAEFSGKAGHAANGCIGRKMLKYRMSQRRIGHQLQYLAGT